MFFLYYNLRANKMHSHFVWPARGIERVQVCSMFGNRMRAIFFKLPIVQGLLCFFATSMRSDSVRPAQGTRHLQLLIRRWTKLLRRLAYSNLHRATCAEQFCTKCQWLAKHVLRGTAFVRVHETAWSWGGAVAAGKAGIGR